MTDHRATRIIGHMVTHNELARYLKLSIPWLRHLTDELYVYDDQSDDGTFQYVREAGIPIGWRHPDAVPFSKDESTFRYNAWKLMESWHHPRTSDWILCIDADELLVTEGHDVKAARHALTDNVERAQHLQADAVTFDVKEIFGFTADHTPLARTDGYWGTITACRLVRWRPGAQFDPRIEGGGSIPAGWGSDLRAEDLSIMHLGYARPEDRHTKHAHYSTTTGHNPRHVASILQPPTTTPWTGPTMNRSWT